MENKMGKILKELRLERGLTQEEVGKIIGVQKAAIQKYEKGDIENMKRSSLIKLSEFYGVPVAYLMGHKDIEGKSSVEDKQLSEYLELLKSRPELKMLFNLTKDATREEVIKAVKIIETILGK
ncbi:MAG: helix-turn-helix transcriptional regulator [Clostridia bacterium]|nr:helix-turn-helix transcriptional regulator [Clostridia bacterium]